MCSSSIPYRPYINLIKLFTNFIVSPSPYNKKTAKHSNYNTLKKINKLLSFYKQIKRNSIYTISESIIFTFSVFSKTDTTFVLPSKSCKPLLSLFTSEVAKIKNSFIYDA